MAPEQPIHAEATLLSGYATRTLTEEERQHIEQHLKTCSACRQELQEVTAMQAALKTAIHQRKGPSPAAFAKVMNRIHEETQPAPREIKLGVNPAWWERMEHVFRSMFEVRWAPMLASFLIIGQAALLLSVLSGPGGQVGTQPGPVYDRGIPQGTPAIPLITLQVSFVETAQEIHLRGLLHELGAGSSMAQPWTADIP
ncbi:MAG: zf-HC2 domain-containing protein [Nitrospirales bacterium]|nr:zf-HC2 domain-containing protein [Nitrospirales bacterium]